MFIGPLPDILHQAEVSIIDSNRCNRPMFYSGKITPRMLCAGHLRGDTDSCQVRMSLYNVQPNVQLWKAWIAACSKQIFSPFYKLLQNPLKTCGYLQNKRLFTLVFILEDKIIFKLK